jgi:hypothetical protein
MTRCVAILVIATLGIPSQAPGQAAADPWRRVPAATTSCFADDGVPGQLHDIRIAIEEDLRQQTEVNNELRRKFEKMDMMEKMQRMREYMAKNPQEAMKLMQAQQQAATGIRTDITSADAANKTLMAQRDELKAAFDKATGDAVAPVDARIKEYVDTKTVLAGEVGRGFPTKAAHDGYVALLAQRDAAYERACTPFFKPGGSYHTWLNDYKTKVAEPNAAAVDARDNIVGQQMVIMQTPNGPGFRPLGPFMSARDYLREAENVYSFRASKAEPIVPMVR